MADREWLQRSLKEASENVNAWPTWKRSLEDAKRGYEEAFSRKLEKDASNTSISSDKSSNEKI